MKRILSLLTILYLLSSVVPTAGASSPFLTLTATKDSLISGSEVTLIIRMQNCDPCQSLVLELYYDADRAFDTVNGKWLLEDTEFSAFDRTTASTAFSVPTDINGDIFSLTLRAKAVSAEQSEIIKVTPIIKNGSISIACPSAKTTVTLRTPSPVDFTGDGQVDRNDAVYLLYHSIFGSESYPISQNGDMNGDRVIDRNDAIYLLFHTVFPESYPINEAKAR